MENAELLLRLRRGDATSYYSEIFRLALSILVDPATKEELFAAFAVLAASFNSFQVATWVNIHNFAPRCLNMCYSKSIVFGSMPKCEVGKILSIGEMKQGFNEVMQT